MPMASMPSSSARQHQLDRVRRPAQEGERRSDTELDIRRTRRWRRRHILPPHQLHAREAGLLGHQPNRSMNEPVGCPAAPVAGQPFAEDPVAAALAVLDAIIIAQPRRGGLAPPFGRDPFGPFDSRDVVHRAPPHEAPRHALGRGVDDVDRLGPVEQVVGSRPRRHCEAGARSNAEGFAPLGLLRRCRLLAMTRQRRNPTARALRKMALLRLRPPHRSRPKLHRQPVDQPRQSRSPSAPRPDCSERRRALPSTPPSARRHRSRTPDRAPPPCRRAVEPDARARGWRSPWPPTRPRCCRRLDSRVSASRRAPRRRS